jgi:lambda family phage tail tape measure protein
MTGAMNTAIDQFVENGKFSFSDFASSVIKDLIKIQLKMAAMKLFEIGFKAVAGAVGGVGGSADNPLAGDIATTFQGMASGGVINSPTIVGERGPELFMPGRSGAIIPNNNLSDYMGNSGGVTYNGTVIQNMQAIDTQSGLEFLAKNKMNIYAINQSASRSMPTSR